MKKTILAIVAIVAMALSSNAATQYSHSLDLNKKDGTKVSYLFLHTPVATFEGDNLKITLSATDESVLHPIDDLESLTFSKTEVEGSVDAILPGSMAFGISAETLDASGLPCCTVVAVYDLEGRLVASSTTGADGSASVAIAHLPAGVYAVKAGNHSFKFIR